MTFQDFILAHLGMVSFSAKVCLVWAVVNYTYPSDPVAEFCDGVLRRPRWDRFWIAAVAVRSITAALVLSWVSGWSICVGLWTLSFAALLPLLRSWIVPSRLAEFEIGFNAAYVAGTIAIAMFLAIPLPASNSPGLVSRQVAAICFVAAIVIAVLRGGTYVVRGVLDKGNILPERPVQSTGKQAGEQALSEVVEVDTAEYNRGRIIGNLERLMLLIFVAMQAYQALAFLITAKGLFRSKNLENPAFAEYFLVGTLVSSMIAVVAGLGIQMVLRVLW